MTAPNGITADIVYQRAVIEHETVGAEELGNVYQQMLQDGDRAKRKNQGSYYTPEVVAQAISRLSLKAGLAQLGPEPWQIMRLVACDPACGSGVFLVQGARWMAREYATRLVGGEPSADLVIAVTPQIILRCVFGMDIDPVAVDLAKLSLSLETDGIITPPMLDRHIICGNPLEGASPPAMDDRTGVARLADAARAA